MGTNCTGSNAEFNGNLIAICCVCLDLYHCNEKLRYGSGLNCASVSYTEVRVLKLKSKKLLIYRCPECSKNGGIQPQLVELIEKLQSSVAKLSSIS